MNHQPFSLEKRVREAFDACGLPVLDYQRTAPNWIRLTVNGTGKTKAEVGALAVWTCSLSTDVRGVQPLGGARFLVELEVDDRTSIHGKPATEWL
jgi:hypothetical protein